MTATDLQRAVPEGEALRYHAPLRAGGRVGLTDERLLVDDDGEVDSIPLLTIEEVTVESFDWFLGVLSALLVGFGLYSLPRSAVGGFAFALFGLASLYRTYGKRNEVSVRVRNRPKPVRFYSAEREDFQRAIAGALDAHEARLDREHDQSTD